jgi:oligopeptide transport system permease protein
MLISLLVSLISTIIGVSIGSYIGYHAGKKLDTYAMRFIDIYNSIPLILLAILFSSIIGGSVMGTIFLFLILTVFNPVAVTRDLVMRVKDTEFLLASKSIGASKYKIITRGILPLIIGRLLSSVIFIFTSIIFMESTLALLGIIKSNDYVTFGTVIDNARTNMQNLTFLLFPAFLLLIMSLSLRFISVGINDAFNVRLNRGK